MSIGLLHFCVLLVVGESSCPKCHVNCAGSGARSRSTDLHERRSRSRPRTVARRRARRDASRAAPLGEFEHPALDSSSLPFILIEYKLFNYSNRSCSFKNNNLFPILTLQWQLHSGHKYNLYTRVCTCIICVSAGAALLGARGRGSAADGAAERLEPTGGTRLGTRRLRTLLDRLCRLTRHTLTLPPASSTLNVLTECFIFKCFSNQRVHFSVPTRGVHRPGPVR